MIQGDNLNVNEPFLDFSRIVIISPSPFTSMDNKSFSQNELILFQTVFHLYFETNVG